MPNPRSNGRRSEPLAARPYRAIFLDAGGTILHLDRAFLLERLAAQGIPCDEPRLRTADRAAKTRLAAAMRSGEAADDASRGRLYFAQLLAQVGCTGEAARAVGEGARTRHREGRLWTYTEPGTLEVLRGLQAQGYVLGVVSNADGRVEEFLRTAGLRDALDFVVDSARVGVEKPDPRIFALACERAGVAPAEALHVGDVYEIDVLGARAAGLAALLVDADPAEPHGCERIARIHDLPAWLEAKRGAAAGA
ncbi:MAG: HAD-IA family hydrolase [Gemmatimonadetes bacterium]|nr:HAD-IA family hydrolase [Gemmatimonadota bacterium]